MEAFFFPGPDEEATEPAAGGAVLLPQEALTSAALAAAVALTGDDPATISVERILAERPDVLRGFYEAFHGPNNDKGSRAWAERVGGETPEAYARYWYDHHGRYEGYNQGPTTAQDNVSVERILAERPDVLRGFYEAFHGPDNDHNSTAWLKRVGGDTPEAYAKYWYETHGRWEGYSQTDKAAAEAIDVARLLVERPDVLRGFYEAFYGPDNDHKSKAWLERVGGDTPEAYAKYWYVAHGRAEGYHQRPAEAAPQPEPEAPYEPDPDQPVVTDPSLEPWNHPAIYPNWPNPGWETGGAAVTLEARPDETPIVVVGGGSDADLFG